MGCLSWPKLGVSTVGLWGVSPLDDGAFYPPFFAGCLPLRAPVFGGYVLTTLSVHGVATRALGIAPSEPVNPLPYCGFGRRNP